jgi:hypothetical protein
LRENLLLYSSYLSLGVPNWTVKNHQHRAATSNKYQYALHQRRKKLKEERDMFMRSPDYNNTSSGVYWDEYSDSSESSMEMHRDPKHSRRTTARTIEESYMKSPSENPPEEEEEFVQETPEAALVAA